MVRQSPQPPSLPSNPLKKSRDSSFTYLHLHSSHHADLLEDFTRIKLPAEEIDVAPQHLPLNPDEEDDIVPDQHAAFGIQRATQKSREPVWRDLGLERLMLEGPPKKASETQTQTGGWVGGSRAIALR